MGLERYLPDILLRHLEVAEATASPFLRFGGMVLVVDMVNSTGITEHFVKSGPDGAERLGALLNDYFGRAFEIAERHGGDVLRIDGDAMVLCWENADTDREVARPLAAALELRDTFAGWQPEPGVVFGQRLTLAWGSMVGMVLGRDEAPRTFAFVGTPMREIAVTSPQGAANEITVCESAVGRLQKAAKLVRGEDKIPRVLHALAADRDAPPPARRAATAGAASPAPRAVAKDFLPRVVVDRTALGEEGIWFPEFRVLSVAQVRVGDSLDERSDDLDRLYDALQVARDTALAAGAAVTDVVDSDKGLVVKCVCGLPSSTHDNNAAHVVDAARRIAAALAATGIGSGIGISTGAAFCGDVGSARRREYLSSGPSLAYAARLMQAASGSILVDDATARATSAYFTFDGPRPYKLKGRPEPVAVHRLMGLAQPGSRSRRPAATTPLVGRNAEVMLAAERLAAGTGGLILLEAEAGGGKSRLLTDILLASETLGLKVFGTSLSPIEQTTVYAAVRQFLPQLLMTLGEPVPVAPEMLRQRVDELLAGSDMQAKAPLLEDIFAAGIARTPFAEQITGAARRNSLEDLVEHLIVKAIPGGRLAIYIDDAHWLDASSAEMLAVLLRRVPTLAVVATMRPSIAAAPQLVDLMKAAAVKIHLPPLSRESIAQLACALLGVASIPERFAAYLYEHSGGLPLHAEQLLLSLRDRGVVSVSSGRCRVEIERLSPDGAPRGVRDIIVSRVDRLEPEAQMAMKVASVMGRVFSQEALRAIHPMAPQGPLLDDHLASLVEAGLLERAAALDTSRFTFRHGVIQEVVYGLLTFGQRRVLHREMAQHLEGAHADLLEPHYVELAEHWEQADDAGHAIRYREMAADSALRRYANYDVLTHVDRLDRLAQRLAVAMPREQKARLARLRGDACQELARFDEAQRHLRQCAELSGISIPTGRLGYAVGLILEVGRQIKHRTIGPRRLADGVAGERERLAAHIHMRLAEHAYFASNALGIMHGTLASLNRAERSEATTEVTVGYGGIAIALGVTGQHRLALYYGARSVAQAERIGTVHDQGIAHLLVAVYAFPAGDWAGVDDHCRSGAALFERVGDSFRRQTCEVIRAYGCIATGRYAEAEQILSSFGDDCEKVDNASVRAWISCARVMLDAVHGTSPAISLQRLAAGWDDTLHSGEKLLWSGMMAATLLQSGDMAGAEAAAERALDNMRASPPTIGVAFASIPSVAEIWLALARRAAAQGSLSHRYMTRAEDTCRLVRSYAAKTRIAFPRACLAAGRLSFMKGRRRKAVRLARRALHEAEAMSMPFEVSMCRDALAEFEGGGVDRVAVKRVG